MQRVNLIMTLFGLALATSASLTAAEIEGRVTEVSDQSVTLTVAGDLLPSVGDEVELYVMLPGLEEEARVATARVTEVGRILVVASIRSATAEIEKGQRARFRSEKPVRRSEFRIPASGAGSTKPWIGVKIDAVRPQIATAAKLPLNTGVRIIGIFPDGPAEKATLRQGDILLQVADQNVTGIAQFNKLIASYAAGADVPFNVLRDGQKFLIVLTIGPYPGGLEEVRGLRVAAERGEAWAQSNLGVMYSFGNKVKYNDAQAVRLYLAAAEAGDMWAHRNLGLRYAAGRGVTQDDREALKWFRKSAEQGYAVAQNGLGWMLANGRGTERNDAEAVKWYRAAAENPVAAGDEYQSGSVYSQNNLAGMYEVGRSVAKDLAQARAWYRKAAENGHADAQFSMGRLYHDGIGVAMDYREAMKWFHLAAKQKHAAGQTMMGIMALNGEGVKKNYQTALAWLKLAVKQKNAAAQNALGVMYLNGWGVQKDEVEAFTLLLKSSEQGYELAKQNLRGMGIEP